MVMSVELPQVVFRLWALSTIFFEDFLMIDNFACIMNGTVSVSLSMCLGIKFPTICELRTCASNKPTLQSLELLVAEFPARCPSE